MAVAISARIAAELAAVLSRRGREVRAGRASPALTSRSLSNSVLKVVSMKGQLFAGYYFDHLTEIRPTTDHAGRILEYTHQLAVDEQSNRHAAGPFCKFKLADVPKLSGVYLVTVGDDLKYVGKCANLSARFGPRGYGSIVTWNCRLKGQSTNCKINASILASAKLGLPVWLWFHPSSDYEGIESALIDRLRPPWNGRGVTTVPTASRSPGTSFVARTPPEGDPKVNTEAFRAALKHEFATAYQRGDKTVVVCAADLHRKVGGYPGARHRMPACCKSMRAAMLGSDTIVDAPLKGSGARLTIEYKLPRA
jgi:hypothetical protein